MTSPVVDDVRRPRHSLVGRAVAALLLMIGFYALALAIVAALVAIPIAEVRYAHRLEFKLAGFCLIGAFAILKAIVPRPDRFEPPGPALTRNEEPRLFAVIDEVARSAEQAMPAEVYLIPGVNAWVAQRGGIMGFGSRRVMGLGLPLLEQLSIDELRAVLAHEFGHYHGGDTALGPWIYKTRAAIGRTLQSLARHSSVLMKPFEWYGLGFLRITHAISRRQEYAADALAARTVGAAPLASGLRTIHGVAGAFVPYWMSEVAPVLERGFRPPIAAGFTHFVNSPSIASQIAAAVEEEMSSGKVDPYDTHPPLRDRIAALGSEGTRAAPDDSARAITLLQNVDGLEAALVAHVGEGTRAAPLAAIAWPDAATRVWTTVWRDRVRIAGDRLNGITPAQVPALAADLPAAAVRFGFAPTREAAEQQGAGNVVELLGSALAVLLLDRGWSVNAMPGAPVSFSREGVSEEPFADIVRLARSDLAAADWETRWRGLGLLDIDLGTPRSNGTARLEPPPRGRAAER